MKKLGLVAAVLLMVASPLWARVDIKCAVDGNIVTVSYAVVGEPNKVSGFGLNITVDQGAVIRDVNNVNPKYWVYPGSIQIDPAANPPITDYGSPVRDPAQYPGGTLGGLDTNGISIECGALYDPPGDNSPNAPPNSGTLLKFRVSKTAGVCVTITEDPMSGGVVLTNPTLNPDVNAPKFCLVSEETCFPTNYIGYADWVTMKRPTCWCAKPKGSGYQCDGDTDGLTEGALKWRVSLNDLNVVIANWKKKITDPTLNPCADIDHKSEGALKWRVSLNDLNIIIANWKKKDAALPGNCPRS